MALPHDHANNWPSVDIYYPSSLDEKDSLLLQQSTEPQHSPSSTKLANSMLSTGNQEEEGKFNITLLSSAPQSLSIQIVDIHREECRFDVLCGLPEELAVMIMSYFTLRELRNLVALVCKEWRRMAGDLSVVTQALLRYNKRRFHGHTHCPGEVIHLHIGQCGKFNQMRSENGYLVGGLCEAGTLDCRKAVLRRTD